MSALNDALTFIVIAMAAAGICQIAPEIFNAIPDELRKPQFVFCVVVGVIIVFFTFLN